ncbi:spindle assembly abnormal protein 6 homolog isoform X2 [Daktulosphaira vitifoliae]|uniref:spindle assembly abnormal protein 6 homolog isoform X2 n=1 Tax=Daktulosphaira vitifoliae TaxID=58002 RepID=UPI0021A9B4F5|nr:spindle assembly abnormal protein 6 homolog isoform X2 [Daktulosphaira vitifoliae]
MKETMYSKIKSVYVKDSGHNDKVPLDIMITVELIYQNNEKILFISASDENDPLFYITANINEDSFRTIKDSQDLVVSFDHFPNQIVQLLNNSDINEGPRFKLLIQDEYIGNKSYKGCKYMFKIIELNEFKNLCHLAIEMSKPSDSDVAKNICKKMNEIKNLIDLKDKETEILKLEVTRLRNDIISKNNELERYQLSMNDEKCSLTARLEKEISLWKEKYEKLDLERMKQLREKHEEMIVQQERLNVSLQTTIKSQNKEIQSLLAQSENKSQQISEMTIQIKSLESRNKTFCEEISSLVATNQNVTSDRDMKKKIIESMQAHISTLEKEIQQNTQLLQKQNNYYEILSNLKEQLTSVKKENEELKKHNEDRLNSMCDELKKANKIIKKLHESNEEQTTKLLLSKDIALRQKEDIIKYQNENDVLTKSFEEKNLKIESLTSELTEVKNRLATVEQNLKEKEERIASNDKVIHWLNSKLNNCEITAKPLSSISETNNITKSNITATKSLGKFSTSTPATTELDEKKTKQIGRRLNLKNGNLTSETLNSNTDIKKSAPIRRVMYGPQNSAYFAV